MKRYDIINLLIKKYNYKKYLEIGVYRKHQCFNKIICEYKKCVDPLLEARADFILTSDNFFEINKETFDIFFIDGLHIKNQVFKDIINSLKYLNSNGTIVCHDLLPKNEIEQVVPIKSKIWLGDCWKAWLDCKSTFDNLEMYIIDTDHGVGIIREGKQEKIIINQELNWEFFFNNKQLMNIISEKHFLEKLKNYYVKT